MPEVLDTAFDKKMSCRVLFLLMVGMDKRGLGSYCRVDRGIDGWI